VLKVIRLVSPSMSAGLHRCPPTHATQYTSRLWLEMCIWMKSIAEVSTQFGDESIERICERASGARVGAKVPACLTFHSICGVRGTSPGSSILFTGCIAVRLLCDDAMHRPFPSCSCLQVPLDVFVRGCSLVTAPEQSEQMPLILTSF